MTEASSNNQQVSQSKQGQDQSKEQQIGNFKIGEQIGKGTFGIVRKGTHIQTGEKVAIKVLEKDKISEQGDIDRINREITILKKVRHPNVVQLFDLIENDHFIYLIMELCSGNELFGFIVEKKRLPEDMACKMYLQLISSVEYIHKLGIVHRDLKPENILLDHYKNIKLIDFGLSNLYKEGELLKTACGSPCYAAPEMIKGDRYIGLNADIWSSGVVLYAMVCGYLPFEDANTKKLYDKILKGEYKLPSFLSDDCKDLISKILNTNPQKRYTIDDIRNHPWSQQVPPYNKSGIVIGKDIYSVDEKIIETIHKEYKFDKEKTTQDIRRNKFNNATTTYFLLLKKKERNEMLKELFGKTDTKTKKSLVSQNTIIDSTKQQQQKQEPTNPTQVPSQPVKQDLNQTVQIQQPIQVTNQNQQPQQRRRDEYSSDVRQPSQQINLIPRQSNKNGTTTTQIPELLNTQKQDHNIMQKTIQLDAFSKLNPKAKQLVENIEQLERQKTLTNKVVGPQQESQTNHKIGSTGGSTSQDQDFLTQQMQSKQFMSKFGTPQISQPQQQAANPQAQIQSINGINLPSTISQVHPSGQSNIGPGYENISMFLNNNGAGLIPSNQEIMNTIVSTTQNSIVNSKQNLQDNLKLPTNHVRSISMQNRPPIPQPQVTMNMPQNLKNGVAYMQVPGKPNNISIVPINQQQLMMNQTQYQSFLMSENNSPHYRSPMQQYTNQAYNAQFLSNTLEQQLQHQKYLYGNSSINKQQPLNVQRVNPNQTIAAIANNQGTMSRKHRTASRATEAGSSPNDVNESHVDTTINQQNQGGAGAYLSYSSNNEMSPQAHTHNANTHNTTTPNAMDMELFISPKVINPHQQNQNQQTLNIMTPSQQPIHMQRNFNQTQINPSQIYNTTRINPHMPSNTHGQNRNQQDYNNAYFQQNSTMTNMQNMSMIQQRPNAQMYYRGTSPQQQIQNHTLYGNLGIGNPYIKMNIGGANSTQYNGNFIGPNNALNLTQNELQAYYANAMNAQQIMNAKRLNNTINTSF